MLGSALAGLALALVAVRFPGVPALALLPAVSLAALAVARPSGAWLSGLPAAALLARLPGGVPLALAVAVTPGVVWLVRTQSSVHHVALAAAAIPAAAYLAASAGSGGFAAPLGYLPHLCAAVAAGATLCALAYAPTQRERLGTGGRTRSGLR